MDEVNIVRLLAKGNCLLAGQIRHLLETDERFTELVEEYQTAAVAFEHWRKLEGADSPKALQYRKVIEERDEELQEHLKHIEPPPGE